MKNRLFSLLTLSVIVLFSCTKDGADPTYQGPSVSAPTSVLNVQSGASGLSVTFNTSIDSDLTATYLANGNGVTINNPFGDVTENSVTINFDTGNTSGAASITLIVTDSKNQSDEATAIINVGAEVTEILMTSNVTEDVTWTADRTYILGGRIAVENGATLTIEPGTVVKGQAGTGANATALIIARGGKLMAEGTAELPIVFTSVADEITSDDIEDGNIASPNLDPDINGLWGGVIVLGYAPISASNDNGDVSEVQIEGVPTSDPNGLYGGNNPEDNSGVLKYISIRHGGSNIGAGNEINGLTLGGVGSGTVVDNIEIVANQDDGIEWFGGTVNVKNVAVWNVGDDGIDTDQSWSGTLDNFVVVTPTGHCFELDGPEGSSKAGHNIQNGSIIASGDDRVSEDLINVYENSIVTLKNLYFRNIVDGQTINRVSAVGVTFEGIELKVSSEDLAKHVNGEVPAGVSIGSAPKADVSVLSWTWTAKSGVLAQL